MNSDNNGFKETLQLYNLCTQKKCGYFNKKSPFERSEGLFHIR